MQIYQGNHIVHTFDEECNGQAVWYHKRCNHLSEPFFVIDPFSPRITKPGTNSIESSLSMVGTSPFSFPKHSDIAATSTCITIAVSSLVLSTALFKMSSSDSDSLSNASQGDESQSRLLESIARCPQAIKDLSDAPINNLEHIAERNQAWLRSEEPRVHREGRSAGTSGVQVSLNASDVRGPGGGVGGGAISSLNGPGSGSGANSRSRLGYEAGDSVTGNEARDSKWGGRDLKG